MDALHISISAEPIAHFAGLTITNSMFTASIVTFFIIVFSLYFNSIITYSGKPSRLQVMFESIIEALMGLIEGVAGKGAKSRAFAPFIVSFFFFIILNNWIGLIPGVGTIGIIEEPNTIEANVVQQVKATTHEESIEETTEVAVHESTELFQSETAEVVASEETISHVGPKFVPLFRPATADLNTTLALALISMSLVQFFGVKYQKMGYFKKFLDISSPIAFIVGILELVSEFAKVISFSFRLFGNIFAGEVLLSVILALVPVVIPMPFYGLEIFVGFIQAVVFSILSLAFFNMATLGHGEEHA